MTCHAVSAFGCTGFELATPVRHGSTPTLAVVASSSLYSSPDLPRTSFFLNNFPIEAPQVVIEASRTTKVSQDSQDQESPSHIFEQGQVLSSIIPNSTSINLSVQQVQHQYSIGCFGLMTLKRKATIVIAAVIASIWGLDKLHDHLDPNPAWRGDEQKEEEAWIASSNSFFDRAACRWLSVCGIGHIGLDPAVGNIQSRNRISKAKAASSSIFEQALETEYSFQESMKTGKILQDVPQYVLDYAPLVYLYSGEEFWPSDLSEHLQHTTPHFNYTLISPEHPTLQNLDRYNDLEDDGRFVFLQSDDNVEGRPEWLKGAANIPTPPEAQSVGSSWADWDSAIDGPTPDDDRESWEDIGIDSTISLGGLRPESKTDNPLTPSEQPQGDELSHKSKEPFTLQQRARTNRNIPQHHSNPATPKSRLSPGGRSSAPAILILVQKTPDIVDAFWFYFYSYNLGNKVLTVRFGNHVGDWEHSLVRFQNGIPRVVFFSEHAGGSAYTYSSVEKIGLRPVVYSAEGTHAMYATPGKHPYVLPGGFLKDVTDKGKLWDPALNLHSYYYNYTMDEGSGSNGTKHDVEENIFRATSLTPNAPTNWFWFSGHWGDKFYKLNDKRQYRFVGQYHYVNGPLGPRFKHLGRRRVCQGSGDNCKILDSITKK